jgi:hypothetical protein
MRFERSLNFGKPFAGSSPGFVGAAFSLPLVFWCWIEAYFFTPMHPLSGLFDLFQGIVGTLGLICFFLLFVVSIISLAILKWRGGSKSLYWKNACLGSLSAFLVLLLFGRVIAESFIRCNDYCAPCNLRNITFEQQATLCKYPGRGTTS